MMMKMKVGGFAYKYKDKILTHSGKNSKIFPTLQSKRYTKRKIRDV